MTTTAEELAWIARLKDLGFAVQRHLRKAMMQGSVEWHEAIAEEAGDTIYAIDRDVEPIIEQTIEGWPAETKPLVLIAEGMGDDGVRQFPVTGNLSVATSLARYRVIIDPIDGTRGLMYDKRSGWFLAAVAHDRGVATTLNDTFAAVMVELPTTKQSMADFFVAGSCHPTQAFRSEIGGDGAVPLVACPSRSTTLKDGFAQVSNFFPGTKVLAAELMERIASATLGGVRPGRADVFDDQYITTGGQLVELIVGHDRFCCDLRPLFYDILEKSQKQPITRGIECHPYDLAGLLVARQSGVIITDGFGQPLDGPLNVHHGMHWCGYANASLRDKIQPVIQEWLKEKGIFLGGN